MGYKEGYKEGKFDRSREHWFCFEPCVRLCIINVCFCHQVLVFLFVVLFNCVQCHLSVLKHHPPSSCQPSAHSPLNLQSSLHLSVDPPSDRMLSGRGRDLLQVSHSVNLLLITGRIPAQLLIPTHQARMQQWMLHRMRQHQSTSHINQWWWYRTKSYVSCRQCSTI